MSKYINKKTAEDNKCCEKLKRGDVEKSKWQDQAVEGRRNLYTDGWEGWSELLTFEWRLEG